MTLQDFQKVFRFASSGLAWSYVDLLKAKGLVGAVTHKPRFAGDTKPFVVIVAEGPANDNEGDQGDEVPQSKLTRAA